MYAVFAKMADTNVKFRAASSVRDSKLLPAFVSTMEQVFAEVHAHPPVKEIKAWITRKTKGKIQQTVQSLDSDKRLVLMNAVYFESI